MNKDNVTKAIVDKFQFTVENTSEEARKLAIIPSYLTAPLKIDGDKFAALFEKKELIKEVALSVAAKSKLAAILALGEISPKGEDVAAVIQSLIDDSFSEEVLVLKADATPAAILQGSVKDALTTAGYAVDAVLGDDNVTLADGKQIKMSAGNPAKKINDFLAYIKTNPKLIRNMTVISDDISAFSTDMEIVNLNPFTRAPESLIDMNQFVDKYQNLEDRVNIVFNQPLEISDVLLWAVTIPPSSKMTFILRF